MKKGDTGGFDPSFSDPALDSLEQEIGDDAPALQQQAEALLDVIFDLAEKSTNFSDFSSKLAQLYPELDTASITQQLQKGAFTSHIWGRLNGEKK